MRPVRASRFAPLALVVLVLSSAACGASAPSSDVGTTALPTTGGSQAPAASAAPSGSGSPFASGSSAAASASPAPTPKPTPKPTAAPTPTPRPTTAPTATPVSYQCASLLHNSEVRKATGLSDATLLNNRNGTPQAVGQTYCPYIAQSGQVTVAAAVWTGTSYAAFLKLWDSVATYSQPVSGIGSRAIIDAGDGVGLAIVGKVGISIQIKGPSGVPAGVDALTACETLLTLLAKRV